MKTTTRKPKMIVMFMMCFLIASMNVLAQSDFAGGSGTQEDPYQVATLEQLQNVKDYLENHFIQVSDIDASGTESWNAGSGFDPINSLTGIFTGSYDGDGYIIENLYISRADTTQVGLFGVSAGVIRNVTLINADVEGANLTGALLGDNQGEVYHCMSSGVILGGRRVGGLVGRNDPGLIEDSHSSCQVTGERDVGGLVGGNRDTIRNCSASGDVSAANSDKPFDSGGLAGSNKGGVILGSYATGSVSAEGKRAGGLTGNHQNTGAHIENCWASGTVSAGDVYAGGLVGRARDSVSIYSSYSTGLVSNPNFPETLGGFTGQLTEEVVLENNYWDTETSDLLNGVGEGDESAEITGLSTAEMTGSAAQENMTGFDFDNVWKLTDGYPKHSWWSLFAAGSGTQEDPFQVATLVQLQKMQDYPASHFIQVDDIDASDTETWNDSTGFIPIGFSGTTFSGSYDGNGFIIENLYIKHLDSTNVGLFSTSSGVIRNVILNNISVQGDNLTGGLVGLNEGEIYNCHTSGVVMGGRRTGGLVGRNDPGLIEDSHSSCQVTGGRDVGGLVGGNRDTIRNCSASGDVTATNSGKPFDCGGLAGSNKGGAIFSSFASGNVSADGKRAGGLVGNHQNDGAQIKNCYALGNVTAGDVYAGGLLGRARDSVSVSYSYSVGQVSNPDYPETLGGFTGQLAEEVEVTDNYWDADSSGVANGVGEGSESDNVTGLTTEDMTGSTAQENMTGFDFENVWLVSESYPILAWERVMYTVSLSANPTEGGTVSQSGEGTYEEGTEITVTASPNSGYLFDNWTKNGSEVSTSQEYTFTVNEDISLTANFSEEATALENVPFGDENILVYPNPTSDYLTIEIKDFSEAVEITVFDLAGKVVHEDIMFVGETRHEVNLLEYHTGVYFIRLKTGSSVYTKKAILQGR